MLGIGLMKKLFLLFVSVVLGILSFVVWVENLVEIYN